MRESVNLFIKTLSSRKHVLQLFRNEEIVIDLVSEEDGLTLIFKDGEVFVTELIYDQGHAFKIQSERMVFNDLLTGKRKLRDIAKKKELFMNIPFRSTLLLEAIFCLSKEDY